MKRGRPFKKGNKFGRGRPRGSRNQKTLAAGEFLTEHGPALLAKARDAALKGDSALLRMFLQYLLPAPQPEPVKTAPLRMESAAQLLATYQRLSKDVASGKITPAQFKQMCDALETGRAILETNNLSARLEALEQTRQDEQEHRKVQ